MNINTNSWHYKIVMKGRSYHRQPTSLCQYIRLLVFKSLYYATLSFLAGIAAFTLLAALGTFWAWGAACLIHGYVRPEYNDFFLFIIGMTTTIVIVVITAWIFIGIFWRWIEQRVSSNEKKIIPQDVKDVFYAVTNKMCVRVNYTTGKE